MARSWRAYRGQRAWHVEREAPGTWLPACRVYSSKREPTTWGRGKRICVAHKGNPPGGQTSLRGISNRAAKDKEHRFGNLYGLLDENYLKWCFWQLNRDAAPGVDRVDFYEYRENLDENIFLGFEFRRAISRNSKPIIRRRTSRKKIRAPIATFTEWIKTKCELSYNWAGFEDLLNQFLIPAPKITEKYPSKQLKLFV